MSSLITPINPERRDPGSIRKKADIGLPNVDNLSTSDYINIILDLVKDSINDDNIYSIGKSDPGVKKIGICQFTTKSAHSMITIGLINPNGDIIECLKLEAIYTENDPNGAIDCRTFVSLGTTYLKDSRLLFYEKIDSVNNKRICNVILELPDVINGNISKLGVNVFEYTLGTKNLDSTKVNDTTLYGDGFTLISELSCAESYLGANTAGSSLGLAVYDEDGKLVKVKVGDSLSSSDNYNFPRINGVPFIAYLDSTVDGESGRDITVPAKHAGPTKVDAGEHSWEVLGEHPQVGLIENVGGFTPNVYQSDSAEYGLCKLSKYSLLPIGTESISSMINNFLLWGNNLSSVNDDVVPVGAMKQAITYLSKMLAAIAGSVVSDKRYTFQFQDSSHSSTSVPTPGGELNYRIISILDTVTADGETETTYPLVSVKSIDQGGASEDWISAEITGLDNDQHVIIKISENTGNEIRRGNIVVTQAESNNILQYDISQTAGNTVIGFRINDTLVTQGSYYEINKTSASFNDVAYALYPVIIANGVESKAEFDDFNLIINKTEGSWLTVVVEEETYQEGGKDYKRKSLKLSASENTSTIASRTATISATYKGESITIKVIQAQAQAYLYINGDKTSNTYVLPTLSTAAQDSSVIIQSNYSWAASETLDWVTIEPISSTAGESALKITVTKNSDTKERSGNIQLKAGDVTKYINITQAASSVYLYLNDIAGDLSLNYTSDGGSADAKNVSIKSNTAWQITDKPSWITINQVSGGSAGVETNTTVKITASANTAAEDRINGIIKVVGGGAERRIIVSQAGTGEITISPNPYTVTYDVYNDISTETTINVLANDMYTITTSSSWIWLSSASGGSSGQGLVSSQFKIRLSGINRTGFTRNGEVVLTSISDSTRKSVISVSQAGNITLTLSSSQLTIPAVPGSETSNYITVSTNVNHSVISNSSSFPSWLTTNPKPGATITPGNNLYVIAQENKTTSDRSFQIKITATDGTDKSVTKTLDIIQLAGTVSSRSQAIAVYADSNIDTISASGGVVTLSCKIDEKITQIINGVDGSSTTYYGVVKTIDDGASFTLVSGVGGSITGAVLTIPENTADSSRNYIVRATYKGLSSSGNNDQTIVQNAPSKTIWYEYSNLVISATDSSVISSGGTVGISSSMTRKTHEIINEIDSVIDTTTVTGISGVYYEWLAKPDTVPSSWVIQDQGHTIKFNENTNGDSTKTATIKGKFSYNQVNTDGSVTGREIESLSISIVQDAAPGEISVSLDEISLESTRGSNASFTLTSNAYWDVNPTDSDKFAVSPTSGSPGDTTITFEANRDNTSSSATSYDTFTFTTRSVSGSTTASCEVRANQKGIDLYANISETQGGPKVYTVTIPSTEGATASKFWVNSNTSWRLTDANNFQDYSFTPQNGTNTTEITAIAKTTNFWPYAVDIGNAALRYTNNYGDSEEYPIEVRQAASAKKIATDVSEVLLGPLKGSVSVVRVTANVSWNAIVLGSGFSINRTNASGSTSAVEIIVTATAASSSLTTTNLGTLTISDGSGTTRVITVKQSAASPYIAGPAEDPFVLGATAGETRDFVFSTNYPWTATIIYNELTSQAQVIDGAAGENLSVELSAVSTNNLISSRNIGTIRVECTAPSGETAVISRTISQRQAYPYIIAPSRVTVKAKAGQLTSLEIQRNYSFNLQTVPTDVTLTPVGSIGYSITAKTDNTSTTQSKFLGNIQLRIDDPLDFSKTVSKTIGVYQEAMSFYVETNVEELIIEPDQPRDSVITIETNASYWDYSITMVDQPDDTWIFGGSTTSDNIILEIPSRKWRDYTAGSELAPSSGIRDYAKPRKGYITITIPDDDPSYSKVIPITQKGYQTSLVVNGKRYWGAESKGNTIDINPTNSASPISYSTSIYGEKYVYNESTNSVEVTPVYTPPRYTLEWSPIVYDQPYPLDVNITDYDTTTIPIPDNMDITVAANTENHVREGYVRPYMYFDSNDESGCRVNFTFYQNIGNLICTPESITMPASGGKFEIHVYANVSKSDIKLGHHQNIVYNGSATVTEDPNGGYIVSGVVTPNSATNKRDTGLISISIPGYSQNIHLDQHYFYPVITNMQTGVTYSPNTGSSDNYNIPVSVGPGSSAAIFNFGYRYSDSSLDPSSFERSTIENSAYAGSDYDRVVGLDQLYTIALTNQSDPSVDGFHVLYNSDNALSTDYYRTFNVKYELVVHPALNKFYNMFKFYLKITKKSG